MVRQPVLAYVEMPDSNDLFKLQLAKDWASHLHGEMEKEYFKKLSQFLNTQIESNIEIYPPQDEIFTAFNLLKFKNVKIVIIGQDPYHGPGQAHGLAFSVNNQTKLPPSLKNIYKELNSDLNIVTSNSGSLSAWASQGVLLINSVLTVEKSKAGSHQKIGWEIFTDKVIEVLNSKKENIVFMLWGKSAQLKGKKINSNRHLILKAPHPSPLSAHRGFLGCKHFSKANEFLKRKEIKEIDWKVSNN